jgi:outer membrane receptor protein involved in Fe transport
VNFYKVLTLWAALLIAPGCGWAQVITGRIFDAQTKEPIVGASIVFLHAKTGVITNEKGNFSLPGTSAQVKVSYVGYTDKVVEVTDKPLSIALSPAEQNLQAVVVTASREAQLRIEAPIAISRLSPTLINDTKPTNVYELINKTPGVYMANYNNEQHGMGIRQPFGTSAYFLYLEDGIPIRPMGVFNHNALIEMNVFAVSTVEVVKGPASSLYGPEAVGGAVNFVTQRPTAVPTARIGVQADNYGYKRVQFGAGAFMTQKFGVYIGGFVAKQRNGWQAFSDYDKFSINARTEYLFLDKTRLIGTVSQNSYNSQTGGSVDSVAFYSRSYSSTTDFTYRKVTSTRARLTLEQDWNSHAQTFVTLIYRNNSIGQNPNYGISWKPGSTTATGQINDNSFHSLGLLAQHTQRFDFLNTKWLTGFTYDNSPNTYRAHQIELDAQLRPGGKSVEKYIFVRDRPDLLLSSYDATIHNLGAYTQIDAELLPRLRASVGLRYDRMAFNYNNFIDNTSGTKSYDRLTPKVGLTYDLGHDRGIYANISQGFSPPGLTTIFSKNPAAAPGTPPFYYNLQPAYFDNYEVGGWASFWNRKVYIDLALYQMNGRNELLNIRQPDNSFFYQSAGRTLHRGVEYSLTYKPSSEWFFRFGGTNALHQFVDFTLSNRTSDAVRTVDGYTMPQAPGWIANTEVTYKPNYTKGLRLSLEWQRLSPYYQNQINTVRYEDRGAFGGRGVSVLNLRAGYTHKSGIEVFANVMNLTNELYAYQATRGNNITDRTTFTPAAPRLVVGGIQYNFTGK